MQLVTPSVVAMVVSMAIANCTMVFQISFFFILHIKFRISELRNREALARDLREAPEHPLELVRLPKQERSARRISQMSRIIFSWDMLELMNSFNLCYSCLLKKSVESFQSPEGLVNCPLSIINCPLSFGFAAPSSVSESGELP